MKVDLTESEVSFLILLLELDLQLKEIPGVLHRVQRKEALVDPETLTQLPKQILAKLQEPK